MLLAAAAIEAVADRRFQTNADRLTHLHDYDSAIQPWFDQHTVEEIVTECQDFRVPAERVYTVAQLLSDEHLAAREFWAEVPGHPGLLRPKLRYRVAGQPHRSAQSSHEPSSSLVSWMALLPRVTSVRASGASAAPALPLAGVRVLDLTRVWAGPFACRILADLGADVIKIESPWDRASGHINDDLGSGAASRPWNLDAQFNKHNRNKRGLGLRLDLPEGKRIFEELVATADVVVENYSARGMRNLGLDPEQLLTINPNLISLGMPGFGRSGPKRDFVAYGPIIDAAAGRTNLTGHDDAMPVKSGVALPDPISGLYGAAAILSALHEQTAGGRIIELSQQESILYVITEDILLTQLAGSPQPRSANRDAVHAPQGAYPSLGSDRWIAISVTSDEAWTALCRVLDLPPGLRTLSRVRRQEDYGRLEMEIAKRTVRWEAKPLARTLQQQGVAASEVRDVRDFLDDAHFAERGMFVTLSHPDAGVYRHVSLPIFLARSPATYRRPAPTLGEHNRTILQEVLGRSSGELDELEEKGIIFTTPPQ